mmetsp:Transcript_88300/g.175504  ORF Transcript_88300/g.175504 Transcript_88300/m.175504 type:complete len:521 (+) Transcript_88300:79-1641(+)
MLPDMPCKLQIVDLAKGKGKCDIIIMFFLIPGLQIFASWDGGATAGCLDTIHGTRSFTDWGEAQMGLFASMSSVGLACSLVWSALLQKVDMKNGLLLAVGLNAVGNFLVGYMVNMWTLYCCKFVLGATQGIVQIWTNCWISSFCPQKHKTVCLTLASTVSTGLGSLLGFSIAGYGTSIGVPYSVFWYVSAGVMWFLWCVIMCVPNSEIEVEIAGDALAGAFSVDCTPTSSNGKLDPMQGVKQPDSVREEPLSNHGGRGLPVLCNGLFLSSAIGIATILYVISAIHFIWVGHFTVAWGVSKRNSVSLFNLVAVIGTAVGLPIAKTVDQFGGCKTPESTSKTMELMLAFMLASVCGASIAVCAIHSQLESLNRFGADEALSNGPQTHGTNQNLSFCLLGLLISFVFCLATQSGLLNVNVSALPLSSVRLGQGFTLSLQNLVGFAMGPFLPRVLMQNLEVYHFAKADTYCYSMAFVLLSLLVPLSFIFWGWCRPGQFCEDEKEGYLALGDGPEFGKCVQHPSQ